MERYTTSRRVGPGVILESWLQVAEGVVPRRLRWYIGTSSPHRQRRRVIDGKISGRIVVSGDEPGSWLHVPEGVVTRRSRWYTGGAWAHLLYLTSSHTSTWKIESARGRSERILFYRSELSIQLRLRPHTYISNTFNVYVTQDKSRIGLSTTTLYLPIVRASLPPHISLLDEWQSSSKGHSFGIQPRAPRVQRIMVFATGDRDIVV